MIRLFAAVLLAGALVPAGEDFAKLSPFEAVRWPGRLPEVRVGGTWYALRGLDGLASAAIVDYCEKTYGSRARKRFEEDLVEVLSGLGRAPGKTVALTLAALEDDRVVEKKGVRMTEDHRQAIWRAAAERERTPPIAGGTDYPKLSPFTAVRFADEGPEVEVDGRYYALVAIEGRAAGEILDFCERTYGSRARKRFAEDLVEVLSRMGVEPGGTVKLALRDPKTRKSVTREKAEMTAENRARVIESASGDGESAPEGPRVERSHGRAPDPRFRSLASVIEAGDTSVLLKRADAEADLDRLEWLLENVHSYLGLVEPDYRAAFDAARLAVERGVTRESFALEIDRLLAVVGDGHTRLDESADAIRPRGYLPFLVGEADGRLAAFREDRADFVEPGFPYLASLDGVPAEAWLETASLFAPRFSPVLARKRSIRELRYLDFLRRVRGLSEGGPVTAVFASGDGREKSVTLELASRRPLYGEWPRTETRLLDGGVGYLRIASMEGGEGFLRGLSGAMEEFRGTRALVIDVRGNGGGSRDALRCLLPCFMADGAAPRIVNVARYRLPPGTPPSPDGHLSDRFLWPAAASVWSESERRAIDAFAREFRPEWEPPAGRFSDWHYFAIGSEMKKSGALRYLRPVAVLMDGDCFSATDVFLGGFKGLPNVTLVGEPSGGGSGRAVGAVLERSGLRVRISTMASFRSDGRLYDGRGVEPDLLVPPKATDLIGRTDAVLDAALRRLSS